MDSELISTFQMKLAESLHAFSELTSKYRNKQYKDKEAALEVENLNSIIDEMHELLQHIPDLSRQAIDSINIVKKLNLIDDGRNVIALENVDKFLREHAQWNEEGWKIICRVEDSAMWVGGKCEVNGELINYIPLAPMVAAIIQKNLKTQQTLETQYAFEPGCYLLETIVAIEDPDGERYFIEGRI